MYSAGRWSTGRFGRVSFTPYLRKFVIAEVREGGLRFISTILRVVFGRRLFLEARLSDI